MRDDNGRFVKGHTIPDEWRKVFAENALRNFKGVPKSHEQRAKISQANKGKTLSPEHRTKLKENHVGMTGRKHSEETKAKMSKSATTHGMTYTKEYMLLSHAKGRAKKLGLDFDLGLGDIEIPEVCPVLGIKLYTGESKLCDNSPTLDRMDLSKGYVKGNVAVISLKANRMKNNATSSVEVQALADWMRSQGL